MAKNFNYCKVKVTTVTGVGSTNPTTTEQTYVFRGSFCYKDTTIAARTGIEHIPADTWRDDIPISRVGDLIKAEVIERQNFTYKTSNGKKVSANVLVSAAKITDLRGPDKAKRLDDVDWKVGDNANGLVTKGKIIKATGKRDAIFN
jgi:hypothetical protein